MRQWDELPEYLTAFGLVPEPDEWRRWQSTLDSLALPVIERSSCTETQVFYTDGACMYPRHQMVRVASGAALRAKADGTFEMAWCGVLPGACQSIFRAELLAVACAIGSATRAYCPHGFKICLQSSSTNYRSVAFRCHAHPPAGKQRPMGVLSYITPWDRRRLCSGPLDQRPREWQERYWRHQNSCMVQPLGRSGSKKGPSRTPLPFVHGNVAGLPTENGSSQRLVLFSSRCSFDLCKWQGLPPGAWASRNRPGASNWYTVVSGFWWRFAPCCLPQRLCNVSS